MRVRLRMIFKDAARRMTYPQTGIRILSFIGVSKVSKPDSLSFFKAIIGLYVRKVDILIVYMSFIELETFY